MFAGCAMMGGFGAALIPKFFDFDFDLAGFGGGSTAFEVELSFRQPVLLESLLGGTLLGCGVGAASFGGADMGGTCAAFNSAFFCSGGCLDPAFRFGFLGGGPVRWGPNLRHFLFSQRGHFRCLYTLPAQLPPHRSHSHVCIGLSTVDTIEWSACTRLISCNVKRKKVTINGAAADQQCKHVNAIGAVATAMAPYTDTESAPVVRTKSAMSAKELSRWGAFAKVDKQRSAARYQHQPGTVAKVDVCGHIGEHRRGRSGDSGQLRC